MNILLQKPNIPTMSSTLTNTVPVFKGENYPPWGTLLQAYLNLHGIGNVTTTECPTARTDPSNAQEIADWKAADTKAKGAIIL